MENNFLYIVSWASLRVNHLDKLKKYEEGYAISQEFCEWTSSISNNLNKHKVSIALVPNFNKENRTV